MANLDELLKKIEKNANDDNRTSKELTIGGETYEVLSMTRAQKKAFIYGQKIGQKDFIAGNLIKSFIPIIYDCFQLKELAIKAKEAQYINSYYDVVEMLFSADELLEIVAFMVEFNNINGDVIKEDVEEIKKQ